MDLPWCFLTLRTAASNGSGSSRVAGFGTGTGTGGTFSAGIAGIDGIAGTRATGIAGIAGIPAGVSIVTPFGTTVGIGTIGKLKPSDRTNLKY